MSTQITTAFVEQYKSNVFHLAQQKGSRLRGAVKSETVTGTSHYFERIGATAAQLRAGGRHSNTPQINTPHSRRKVTLADYDWADLIDQEDKVRLLISPQSEYAKAGAYAMGRAMDDAIIAAASGNAFTGPAGATPSALPAGQKIAVGTTSLTVAKLIAAKEIIDAADVDPDETKYLVCSAKEITSLLGDDKVTSADYNSVKALVAGQVDTFMGFNFIRTERIAASGGDNLALAFTQSAIGLALGKDISTRISERDDKNYATQVFLSMTIGATRVEDEKVVEIACNV
ncbi:phage capsid protein [Flavobacteriaceae bacterium]|nr:phage capsid protein [Flavobacteriaceae bacterium]